MISGLRLTREVARADSQCHWCRYPVVAYSPRYDLTIGGVALHAGYCSGRCAEIDARVNRRGALLTGYAS